VEGVEGEEGVEGLDGVEGEEVCERTTVATPSRTTASNKVSFISIKLCIEVDREVEIAHGR
jgi:hypothetical protein